MKVVGIRVYYADGSVVSTAECSLHQFPLSGVISVNVYYDEKYVCHRDHFLRSHNYKDTLTGEDVYWINPDDPIEHGVCSKIADAPAGSIRFMGKEVPKELYYKIYDRAYGEHNF